MRRASRISSPIVDPLSTPPNANAIVDQKITSFRLVLGTSVCAVIGVAVPNRRHEIAPSSISTSAGIQPARAPTLFNHLPTSSPTMFIAAAIVRPASAKTMKYAGCEASGCQASPPMNNAFAAAK